MALDVAIADPTAKTYLDANSHRVPLKAAHKRYTDKMGTHNTAKAIAGAAGTGLQFAKLPLVFEATGAMGAETQKWWNDLVKMATEQDGDGNPTRSRRQLGLDHTWSANDWPTYWLQRISIAHSRHQAESITQLIGASLPTRFGLV